MSRKRTYSRGLTRREMLKYGLYGGLAAGLPGSLWLGGCGKKQADIRPTNIILISIDTLRADHLGCYGYQRPTSPTLDKLASQGLLFEDVTATSPWTLPSHGSMLTGLYPNRHGLKSLDKYLPTDVVTLADVLKEHDFSTATVVNSIYLSRKWGLDRGFDDFTYVEEIPDLWMPSEVEHHTVKWLSKNSSQPFFLFLHYYDVHSDYSSTLRYEKQFVRPYKGVADGTTVQLSLFRKNLVSLNQVDAEHLIDLYDASIRQLDDGIARLLKLLETRGLLDNSLIIVTSDHGEEFLDHGGVLHSQTQYQELIHIPLIMRGPGLGQPKRLSNIISLVDVMPTVLSLLGIAIPYSMDGIDLCRLWEKSDTQLGRRYIFAEGSKESVVPQEYDVKHDIKRAVRHPRYKLHYNKLTKEKRLFDLQNDPKEKIDIVSKHTPLVDSMFAQLKSFMGISKAGSSLPPLTPEEINKLKSLGYL